MSYDDWKTHSPDDDQQDWGNHCETCGAAVMAEDVWCRACRDEQQRERDQQQRAEEQRRQESRRWSA